MKKIFYILALMLAIIFIKNENILAQDFHYTQFYNSPMNLNPASTGVFKGDHRFIGSLRQQWSKINQAWKTFGGSYDTKIMPKESTKSFIGWGIQFNYDRDGLSNLSLANLNVSGSYSYFLNKSNIITGGLTLGFANRGFNPSGLTWGNQWDGAQFVSSLDIKEPWDSESVSILETAVGVNYRWQKSSRTKVDLGAGLFHLTAPSANYYTNESQNLPRRLSLSAIGNIQVLRYLDVQLSVYNQYQGEYSELLLGGLLKFYLTQKKGRGAQLHVGLGYRTSESLFPKLAIEYKNIYVGLSYDVDLSPFNVDTNKRGGPEVHFRYIITKVKPLALHKVCPIY